MMYHFISPPSPVDALESLATLLLLVFTVSLVVLILFVRPIVATSDNDLYAKLLQLREKLVAIDRSVKTAEAGLSEQTRLSKNTSDLIDRNNGLLPDMAEKIRATVIRSNAMMAKVDAIDNKYTDEKLRLGDAYNLANITEPFHADIRKRYVELTKTTLPMAKRVITKTGSLQQSLGAIEERIETLLDELKRIDRDFASLPADVASRKQLESSLRTLLDTREKISVKNVGLIRRYNTLANRSNRYEIMIVDPTLDDYYKDEYDLQETSKRVLAHNVFKDNCYADDKSMPLWLVFVPNLRIKKPNDLPTVTRTNWPETYTSVGYNDRSYYVKAKWTSASTNATDFYIASSNPCTTDMSYYNAERATSDLPGNDVGLMSMQWISNSQNKGSTLPNNQMTVILFRSIQIKLGDLSKFLLDEYRKFISENTRDIVFVGLVQASYDERARFVELLDNEQSKFPSRLTTHFSTNTANPPETLALAYKALPFYAGTAPLEYYGYGKDKKTFVYKVVTERPYI